MSKRRYSRRSAPDFGSIEALERERNRKQRAPRKPRAPRVRASKEERASGNWPAYVTMGANPDGSLIVRKFRNRAEADEAGLPWVGR